jgi:hypothetical protein
LQRINYMSVAEISHVLAQVEPQVHQGFATYNAEQFEALPKMDFETYRLMCDGGTDNFRRVGFLTEEAWEGAWADERTVFTAIGGQQVPALAPVGHEHGFDRSRTETLTSHENTLLLALPLSIVEEGALATPAHVWARGGLDPDAAILIEQPLPVGTEEISSEDRLVAYKAGQREVLSKIGAFGHLESHDFIDPRAEANTGIADGPAGMGYFMYSYESTEKAKKGVRAETLDEAWIQYCAAHGMEPTPDENSTGDYLFTAEQLRDAPDIVEKLWGITAKGFGKVLGEYHPVSMEEGGPEAFKELLKVNGARIAVHYEDGEPMCFGLFSFDIDSWTWMKQDAPCVAETIKEVEASEEQMVGFAALISSIEGVGHAHKVLGMLFELCGRMQIDWRVFYESTNFSFPIIRHLGETCVEDSKYVDVKTRVKLLDRIGYWYATRRPAPRAPIGGVVESGLPQAA